jgi:hypothetical protein
MLFHVHLCLVILARNGRRNEDDQPDRSRHCRPDGTALTSLLCDDRYRPVGEAGAIGYLLLSSKSELRFGTYSFGRDYGCTHPGMPLCHKQSRRSRDAPILELAQHCVEALQRTISSIPRSHRLPPGCLTQPRKCHPERSLSQSYRDRRSRRTCFALASNPHANAISIAPTVISDPPTTFSTFKCSPRNNHAHTITSTTLNLSIGATLDAGPSCSALK